MRTLVVSALAAVALGAVRSDVQQSSAPRTVDGFVARVYTTANGSMPYRLFVPERYDPRKKYPLVLWLHGVGGRGSDNIGQISGDQVPGTRFWTTPVAQAKYPAFVLAPQTASTWLGGNPEQPFGIIEALSKEFNIDPSRLYLAGQSMGAFGAWNMLIERPGFFAAAVILCGSGESRYAATIAKVSIWAFQGAQDFSGYVDGMREMIAALKKAGGVPRYTEYPGVGHDVWTRAFKEPELLDWVFAQRRSPA